MQACSVNVEVLLEIWTVELLMIGPQSAEAIFPYLFCILNPAPTLLFKMLEKCSMPYI